MKTTKRHERMHLLHNLQQQKRMEFKHLKLRRRARCLVPNSLSSQKKAKSRIRAFSKPPTISITIPLHSRQHHPSALCHQPLPLPLLFPVYPLLFHLLQASFHLHQTRIHLNKIEKQTLILLAAARSVCCWIPHRMHPRLHF